MGLHWLSKEQTLFYFLPVSGGVKKKDWLCELGCRAMWMTCKIKNPCPAPWGFQFCCTGCFPFLSIGRNQKCPTSKNKTKPNHNSEDSAGDKDCSPEASCYTPFPLPPFWSGSWVLMFTSHVCWAVAMCHTQRALKEEFLESASSH